MQINLFLCRRDGTLLVGGSCPMPLIRFSRSTLPRPLFAAAREDVFPPSDLLSPSCHHRAFCCRSVAVTPLIALALAPSIACRHRAVRRRRQRCRRRSTAAKLPPTSCCRWRGGGGSVLLRCRQRRRCRAAAIALLPLRCRRRAVHRCRAAAAVAKLPLTLRCRHCRCRCRRAAVCWLVVALLSVVQFHHCMPSCHHQRSRCRPLSPLCRHCRRQAAADLALPPPPRRRSLVGCCVVVRRPISSVAGRFRR